MKNKKFSLIHNMKCSFLKQRVYGSCAAPGRVLVHNPAARSEQMVWFIILSITFCVIMFMCAAFGESRIPPAELMLVITIVCLETPRCNRTLWTLSKVLYCIHIMMEMRWFIIRSAIFISQAGLSCGGRRILRVAQTHAFQYICVSWNASLCHCKTGAAFYKSYTSYCVSMN